MARKFDVKKGVLLIAQAVVLFLIAIMLSNPTWNH